MKKIDKIDEDVLQSCLLNLVFSIYSILFFQSFQSYFLNLNPQPQNLKSETQIYKIYDYKSKIQKRIKNKNEFILLKFQIKKW
ncbi:MAG: hypothetical protein A2X08_00670 [Bacteroidetes bacterium GWA2_32_17]|nr:MAG: hypothetical protein A2X08_00670 [Bacteroidetes bacterium GWA2_32_17]